jgi:hypothetical protein
LEPAQGAQHGYRAAQEMQKNPGRAMRHSRRGVAERCYSVAVLRGGGLVCHRADAQPLYPTWLNQPQAEPLRLLTMPADFVLHSFRHTYCTRLGETGADAFTIMRLMGHGTVAVSQRYVHPSPEAMDYAVTRLEAWNRARWQGVGHKVGRSQGADSGRKLTSYLDSICPGGGTGRHKGLKILCC